MFGIKVIEIIHSRRDIVNEMYENLYRFKNMNIMIIFTVCGYQLIRG